MSSPLDLEVKEFVDLKLLLGTVWAKKNQILIIFIVSLSIGVAVAFSIPNQYRSTAVLIPSDKMSAGNLSSFGGGIGSLASLAGVSIPGSVDQVDVALEILKSVSFFEYVAKKNNILVPLMAAEGWDGQKRRLLISEKIYDEAEERWVRDVKYPRKAKPSFLEAHERYLEILTVRQDKSTKLVNVSIDFYSPQHAKEWVSLLVDELNNYLRVKDVSEAERSIIFLNREIESTAVVEMKKMLSEMVKEQTQIVMFASVREGYAFSVLEPAFEAEKKHSPNRLLILFLFAVIGGCLGGAYCLFEYFRAFN